MFYSVCLESNVDQVDFQVLSNTIKYDQTRSPTVNVKMFGHQTIFDPVVSANISGLDRALGSRLLACYFGLTHVL